MPASVSGEELERLHEQRVLWLERIEGPVVALPTEYPDGYLVPRHSHSRSQLLYASTGVVLVTTDAGRWMVPPEHAIWLPAGVHHAVEILGAVSMRSIYIAPDARDGLPTHLHVVTLTDLMRCLILEAVTLDDNPPPGSRGSLVIGLLLDELGNLPEQPLGLPFPADPRLAALCRRFIEEPSPHATIDEWAAALAMSRRSFTRSFQRETGLSFSLWRQQACLFAALPRLADGEPVTSVALDLGYDSVPAFTTMFKRMLGVSPRFYRSGVLVKGVGE
ncbi:AraC family transcriptional regulator [Paramesorhizobium deserti]|uniref:AraC family transcriptional regulator n=1 Tax=Paramesorhizobium deserti TaxID=1494590 RepID=A0A135HXX1_9HYPH|nr:helix-turn-helix transcriptional regulator [Paramesorhizobium deserti]KXF78029.1 AraC family transcriptional regulator [Paramesorhizobium deserti]